MENNVALFDENTIGGNSIIAVNEYGNTTLTPDVGSMNWNQVYCDLQNDQIVVSLEPIKPTVEQVIEDENLINDTWYFDENSLRELLSDDDEAIYKLVGLMYNKISVLKDTETLIEVLRFIQFRNKVSLERAFLEVEVMSLSDINSVIEKLKILEKATENEDEEDEEDIIY